MFMNNKSKKRKEKFSILALLIKLGQKFRQIYNIHISYNENTAKKEQNIYGQTVKCLFVFFSKNMEG